jgi:hypothetical protein
MTAEHKAALLILLAVLGSAAVLAWLYRTQPVPARQGPSQRDLDDTIGEITSYVRKQAS